MTPLRDLDIRAALRKKIPPRGRGFHDALVVEELGVLHGASRVDVAVLGRLLLGFEIKSDLDTLDRLPDQIRLYSSALDEITIICGWRHCVPTMHLVPRWWGVTLVVRGPRGAVHFSPLRMPMLNPAPDPHALVRLLWRAEALGILEDFGAASGLGSKPRARVYDRLADLIRDYDLLRALVCAQLKRRPDWRSAAQ